VSESAFVIIFSPTNSNIYSFLTITSSLDSTCQAWGIDSSVPIIVKLSVNDKSYLSSTSAPSVECYQRDSTGAKKSFKVGEQLKSLLAAFVRFHWPSNSKQEMKAQKLENVDAFRRTGKDKQMEKRLIERKPDTSFFGKIGEWFGGNTGSTLVYEVDSSWLSYLVSMEFEQELAFNALTYGNTLRLPCPY